jgi:hypothetical protein
MIVLVSTIIISISIITEEYAGNKDPGIPQVLGEHYHQYDSPNINNNNK